VLPRVTTALLKFGKPVPTRPPIAVARVPGSGAPSGGSGGGFERYSGQPGLTFVRPEPSPREGDLPSSGSEKERPQLHLVSSQAHPGTSPSVATAFLDLFQFVRKQRGALIRWVGVKNYRETVRAFSRSLKVRKGAMLDQKAE
jgi:hypothetical protein